MQVNPNKIERIVVFSKPSCPFCVKAKELMEENNLSYKENIVGDDCTKTDMQEAIKMLDPSQETDSLNTVPQIIVFGKDEDDSKQVNHIGGYDEFSEYMKN